MLFNSASIPAVNLALDNLASASTTRHNRNNSKRLEQNKISFSGQLITDGKRRKSSLVESVQSARPRMHSRRISDLRDDAKSTSDISLSIKRSVISRYKSWAEDEMAFSSVIKTGG